MHCRGKPRRFCTIRDIKQEQPIPEQIAIPLLEATQGESREELQDIYAALLANAMDPTF